MNTDKYIFSKIHIVVGVVIMTITLIISAIIGWYLYDWECFKKDAIEIDAVITYMPQDINANDSVHIVEIEYTYNDISYNTNYPNYNSTMYIGQHISILVDKNNPDDIKPTSVTVVYIGLIVCMLLAIFGGSMIFREIQKGIYINRLIAKDMYIFADYERQKITPLVVNNKRYFATVFCHKAATGEEFHFESAAYLLENCPFEEGKGARVYVDLDVNPKKYYVSLPVNDKLYTSY